MIILKREITSSLMLLLHERVTSDVGERPVLWFVLDILDQKLSSKYARQGRGGAKEWKREEIRESTEKEFLCGRNETLAHKYMLPVQLALYTFLLSVHLSLFLLLRFTTLFVYTHIHAYFKYLSSVLCLFTLLYDVYVCTFT